jgi:hypothetical protein
MRKTLMLTWLSADAAAMPARAIMRHCYVFDAA